MEENKKTDVQFEETATSETEIQVEKSTKKTLDDLKDKAKETLTKENLNNAVDTVKESLTKENLEKTVANVKESLNEENREETIKNIKSNPKFKKIITIVAIFLVVIFIFKGCGGSNVIVKSETAPYGAEFNITLDVLLEKYNENVENNELCLDTLKYYTLKVSKDSLMDTKTEVDENTIGYQVEYNSSIMWVSSVSIYVNPATDNVTNILFETNTNNDQIDMAFNYLVPALWMAPVYNESVEDVMENKLYLDYNEHIHEDGIFIAKSIDDNINTNLVFFAMTDDYYEENFGD